MELTKEQMLGVRIGGRPIPAGTEPLLVARELLCGAESSTWQGRLRDSRPAIRHATDDIDLLDFCDVLEGSNSHAFALSFYVPPSASIAPTVLDDPLLAGWIDDLLLEQTKHTLIDQIERDGLAGSGELLIALVKPSPNEMKYPDGTPATHLRACICSLDPQHPLDFDALREHMPALAISYSVRLFRRLRDVGVPVRTGPFGWELEWITDEAVRTAYGLDDITPEAKP